MRFLSIVFAFFLFFGNVQSSEVERANSRYIYWGLLGSYPAEDHFNPYKLTRDDSSVDVGSLLYSIKRDFKSIEEIAGETGISQATIEQKLRQLIECDLVIEKNDAFIVNFPFWDEPLRDRIVELGFEISGKIVDILKAEIPGLKELVASSTLIEQGYS